MESKARIHSPVAPRCLRTARQGRSIPLKKSSRLEFNLGLAAITGVSQTVGTDEFALGALNAVAAARFVLHGFGHLNLGCDPGFVLGRRLRTPSLYSEGMQDKKQRKLVEARAALLAEMVELRGFLHGSWIERYSVCSRPGCRCHQDERHGPRHDVVIHVGGQQRQKYIPNSQADAACRGIAQHKHLLTLVERITQINLSLMQEGLLHED